MGRPRTYCAAFNCRHVCAAHGLCAKHYRRAQARLRQMPPTLQHADVCQCGACRVRKGILKARARREEMAGREFALKEIA